MTFFLPRFLLLLLLCLAGFSQAAIVTTIKPLTLIANEVTRGIEQPQQLLANGVSAHDYALRPSERLRLQHAELVVWVGASHEVFLQKVLQNNVHTISLDTLTNAQRLPWRNLDSNLPQAHTIDSHLWLSPQNAINLAYKIADIRGQQRPKDAAKYQQNAANFAKNMQLRVQVLQHKFAQLPQRNYLAYHDAYHYVEAALGLQYRGSLSISPEQKPSLKHLLTLKQQVQQQHWQCLLTEPQFDNNLADKVFGSSGRYVVVDETFSLATSYEEGFVQMAEGIYRCLQ